MGRFSISILVWRHMTLKLMVFRLWQMNFASCEESTGSPVRVYFYVLLSSETQLKRLFQISFALWTVYTLLMHLHTLLPFWPPLISPLPPLSW